MQKSDFFYGLIIGDALGTSINGLSKGNIRSTFKNITNYTDPYNAIKANPTKWKKPALYSVISQISLISALSASQRRIDKNSITTHLSKSIDIVNTEFGIYRHPNQNLSFLLTNLLDDSKLEKFSPGLYNSAFVLPISAALCLAHPNFDKIAMIDLIKFASIFTLNYANIAGAIIFSYLVISLIKKHDTIEKHAITKHAAIIAEKCVQDSKDIFPEIFDTGLSPDSVYDALSKYKELFEELNSTTFENSEKKIVNIVNKLLKSPATRATIDHPYSILPFAVKFIENYSNTPEQIILKSAEEGGSTQIFCTITCALSSIIFGNQIINNNLKDNLINKKKINNILETILTQKATIHTINDFIIEEAPLTEKELEEREAKIKHFKPKSNKKKKQTRKSIENQLSQHVVESWTKLDKAKWKKEKKKHTANEFEEEI